MGSAFPIPPPSWRGDSLNPGPTLGRRTKNCKANCEQPPRSLLALYRIVQPRTMVAVFATSTSHLHAAVSIMNPGAPFVTYSDRWAMMLIRTGIDRLLAAVQRLTVGGGAF